MVPCAPSGLTDPGGRLGMSVIADSAQFSVATTELADATTTSLSSQNGRRAALEFDITIT